MPIRGILFDKDGTLFDFEASWSEWAAGLFLDLAAGDPGLAEALADRAGYDMTRRRFLPGSPVIAGTLEELAMRLDPLLSAPGIAVLVDRMNAAAAEAPMVPVAPLAPLLRALRAEGMKLGVATNAAEVEARAHLTAAGVSADFDFVAGFDTGYGAKPDPGMCHGFADTMGLDAAEVLMVGDSLHDLRAGRAAGMQVVGVLTGLAPADELAPHADAVLPDIAHLPVLLREMGDHGAETAGSGPKATRSVAI
ncbi:HAD-superfamily hydrolase, subfamily IA, variant 1 family protein [Roseibacterium elongatum DSM 19469]|uniref:phosphoglycolate phosphatase n=1 Tax=Roseicyclus elongatus DSM 19469 TaxID=1294273 RepID=W8SJ37_9RHOB|nr:HAD family hydrolase [Roseibacterium elongatum]AHM02500.1 HAD-superfamily hydrolase, subfamily IA, variant 1 family protein [Roseibacterium elongatum DSM 19469]